MTKYERIFIVYETALRISLLSGQGNTKDVESASFRICDKEQQLKAGQVLQECLHSYC